jgi:hypothetical protein
MELPGYVGHEESHFFLFGDSASVVARYMHGLLVSVLSEIMLMVYAQKYMLILNTLIFNICMVCKIHAQKLF